MHLMKLISNAAVSSYRPTYRVTERDSESETDKVTNTDIDSQEQRDRKS